MPAHNSKEPANAKEIIDSLLSELGETNRGLVALTLEAEKRLEDRGAKLRSAQEELQRTNSELLQLTLELEDRVSERTRALRESEERFRVTFEQAAVGIAHTAPGGHCLRVNQKLCDITGYTEAELRERTFQDITHPEDLESDRVFISKLLSGILPAYSLEKRILKKGGRIIWTQMTVSLVRDESGGPKYLINVIEDITNQKWAEEEIRRLNVDLEERVVQRTRQLEDANKELESFSYSVSHDLRAPLRAIDGFSKVLLEDYAQRLDPEGQQVLATIRNNTKRMGQLIDDLLAFSRIGRSDLRRSDIDMAELVRSAFTEVTFGMNNHPIKFVLLPLSAGFGDPPLIRQVWTNLLSNAVKFTSKNLAPVIEVGSVLNADEPTFYVKDNGVGFDMQYVNKMFGVFQRLHSRKEFEGTGVGLAIVQRIVHRHGGSVWATGKVNEGATISFTLPRKECDH